MSGDDRTRRLAENEAMFRSVNESVSEIARGQRRDDHVFQFLCECSDASCREQVRMTLAQYEQVRARGELFALVSGHEDPRIERVVERFDEYAVVEKLGEGAEVAKDRDPRR